MRGQAKAPSAGSTSGTGSDRGSLGRAAIVALALFGLTLVLGLTSALAGKEPIALFGPSGAVAVNQSTGEVYVQDYEANKIQRFDADGNFISEFGSEGSGEGQFNFGFTGTGLAVDPADGELYVADVGNHRVQKFDEDGNYVSEFGSEGSGAGQFAGFVMGIGVNPISGEVYVADTGNDRVQRFDSSGNYAGQFGGLGSGNGQFDSPRDIGIDSTGDVYVVDRQNSRVQKFSSSGFFLSVFYTPSGPLLGRTPRQVEVDPATDHVYITQVGDNHSGGDIPDRILEFSPGGEQVDTHSPFGDLAEAGLALNSSSGRIYEASTSGIAILDDVTPPTATLAPTPVTDITTTSATFHGSVDPGGEPASYRFEYSPDGVDWIHVPDTDVEIGSGSSDVPVEQSIGGLEPGKTYRLRLFANRPLFGGTGATTSAETIFTMDPIPPSAETVGWPYRTSTTLSLAARINPHNTATTYYFEYGPTSSYGSTVPAAEDGDAGDGALAKLVLEELSGLAPSTAIHYRIVASNAAGTVTGEDRVASTRAQDEVFGHGRVPGPPGSDRAYEQVNLPDTNGNQISTVGGIATSGNRVLYAIGGGTPQSQNGERSQYVAERTASGWKSVNIEPTRADANGGFGWYPHGNGDLSEVANFVQRRDGRVSFWSLHPGGSPVPIGSSVDAPDGIAGYGSSQDMSTHIVAVNSNIFEVTSTGLEMVGLLPDDTPPLCGIGGDNITRWLAGAQSDSAWPETHQISSDGRRIFFNARDSCGSSKLFMREADSTGSLANGETTLVSGTPLSGPDWSRVFLSATPGGPDDPDPKVFFWTKSRLASEDEVTAENPENPNEFLPNGGDIYSYSLLSGSTDCLTCIAPHADVILSNGGAPYEGIAVAEDGSRIYFASTRALIEGEGIENAANIYRYDVAADELSYVATANMAGDGVEGVVGIDVEGGEALSSNGSVLIFRSSAPSLNPLTDSDNGGFQQYYRYDDRDRSLVCVSCPDNGLPTEDVTEVLVQGNRQSVRATPLSADGDFYFSTVDRLLATDQNTAGPGQSPGSGTDIYEWRDGRLLLVTDGITSYGFQQEPTVAGSTASGQDVFFMATARLTSDVVDGFKKLYDARIGGGFNFPPPPPPCSLDACQGEAKGAPEIPAIGSASFSGPGNPKAKAKKRHKRKQHKKRQQKQKRHAKHATRRHG